MIICNNVWSQENLVGRNKATIICGQSATIGFEGVGNACYSWFPITDLDDPKSPYPIATPKETTTYTLTIMDENFSNKITKEVKINVVGLEKIEVTPKQCCWKSGDAITLDQFDITTRPEGLEENITLDISEAPDLARSTGQQLITFTYTCQNNNVSANTNITIIDEDFEQVKIPIKIPSLLEDIAQAEEDLRAYTNYLIVPRCIPSAEITKNLSISSIYKCCGQLVHNGTTTTNHEKCYGPATKISGEFVVAAGYDCSFPFYGMPHVASFNIDIGGDIKATLIKGDLTFAEFACRDNPKLCLNVGFVSELYGGISGKVLNGAAVEANLRAVIQLDWANMSYCLGDATPTPPSTRKFKLDVKGKICLFSMFEISLVDKNIIPLRCF